MSIRVFVAPFVVGPDPAEPMFGRASRLAFRISDRELCDRLKSPNGYGLPIEMLIHNLEAVDAGRLDAGDLLLVEAGQFVHANGKVLLGAASVDESAVTGSSSYVLRDSGSDAIVMRDSLVVSGAIVIEVTPRLGHPLDWIKNTSASSPTCNASERPLGD